MTRFGWLVVSGIIVAALGIALLLWGFARQSAPKLEEGNLTPVVDYSTVNIHASGEYGFTITYPATATVAEADESVAWRANVSASGTPVVHFTTTGGEVRIGASRDPRALEGCEEKGPSEENAGTQTFGNATWQVFTFDELGTEDERHVTSYRTLHDGQCFVLETYEPLADTGAAPTESPEFIVRSFTFAR